MGTFKGDADPDSFAGTWDPDLFLGRGGDDTAYGWDGNDTFWGGAGNDMFLGQDGDDLAYGGEGDDDMQGDSGNDQFYGGAGNDRIMLGTFAATYGAAYGGAGNDVLQALHVGSGATLDGGAGIDTAALYFTALNPAGNVTIDFSALPAAASDLGGAISLRSVERLYAFIGSEGNHHVIGSRWGDVVMLTDDAGASVVDTGAGRDEVRAEANLGHVLEGGAGIDRLRLTGNGPLTLVVDDATGTANDGIDTIHGFENYETVILGAAQVWFGAGQDAFYGGNFDDLAYGGGGDDRLQGRGGVDTLYGDEGRDFLAGGEGNDLLYGGTGADTLVGGAGVDTVYGGDGDDEIRGGGRGAGVYYGGDGADRFVFAQGQLSAHMIQDFASGEDSLHFARALLQFGPAEAGALDPRLFATGTAVGEAAQFVLTERGDLNETWLEWDPNGADPAGGTYVMARFAAGTVLTAADIFLI